MRTYDANRRRKIKEKKCSSRPVPAASQPEMKGYQDPTIHPYETLLNLRMFKNGRKQQREGRRREERNEWRLSPKGNKGVMKDDVKKSEFQIAKL